jgi:anti-anti-sigma factor
LEAGVRQLGNAAVINLQGEIDSFADEALNQAFAEASQSPATAILLNFQQVEYINSTGIALIVGLLARARQLGRRLLVCNLSPHYTEIFQITRLSDFMSLYPDEASALAGIA